jgi:hypothetical protein
LMPYVMPGFNHFLPYIRPREKKPPKDKREVMAGFELFLTSQMRIAFIDNLFNNILYVGPLRERIPRYGILGTMPYTELGPSGQNLMRVLSETQIRGSAKKTMIEELNYWLDKESGL